MKNDSLDDRMKDHESLFRYKLPRRAYTMIRLDEKDFPGVKHRIIGVDI